MICWVFVYRETAWYCTTFFTSTDADKSAILAGYTNTNEHLGTIIDPKLCQTGRWYSKNTMTSTVFHVVWKFVELVNGLYRNTTFPQILKSGSPSWKNNRNLFGVSRRKAGTSQFLRALLNKKWLELAANSSVLQLKVLAKAWTNDRLEISWEEFGLVLLSFSCILDAPANSEFFPARREEAKVSCACCRSRTLLSRTSHGEKPSW